MPRPKGFRKPIKPIPEVVDTVDGNPWTIEEAFLARTSIPEKKIYVPFGDDEFSATARTHEMAHVRWSPPTPEPISGVSPDLLLACEDARLSVLMHAVDIDNQLSLFASQETQQRLRGHIASSAELAASILVSTTNTPDEKIVADIVAERSPSLVRVVQSAVQRFLETPAVSYRSGEDPSFYVPFDNTVRLARTIAGFVSPKGKEGEEGEWDEDIMSGLEAMGEFLSGIEGDREGDGEGRHEDVTWGELRTEKPALPITLPPYLRHTVKRSVTEGIFMTRPHRYMVDKAIFSHKVKKAGGGSVLIDASGSMDLSSEELLSLVKLLPAATVALYYGRSSDGYLVYIAENGRRVENPRDHVHGMGNVVDGPALDWLLTQSEPRIWVSDGVVTGVGDTISPKLTREAMGKVVTGKVKRLNDLSEVEEYIVQKGYAARL